MPSNRSHSFLFVAIVALLVAVRSAHAFVVTGATGGTNKTTGQRPFRQDIIKMQRTGGPAWDLYLLALQQMQQKNQSDPLSFFQFAGIHGFPAVDWDGVPATANPQTPGYATHNDILFGPWHRVYLAAYEQLIQQNAQQIAAQYPEKLRSKYQNAANTLRIPYWDWASFPAMPGAVTQPVLMVTTPTGLRYINNPLVAFKFNPIPIGNQFPQDFPLSHDPKTVRTPDDKLVSQSAAINKVLLANGAATRDKVYYLISRQTEYAPFSNTGYPAELRNGSYDSIESIHNQIHGMVGGSGHMAYIPFSAFDPIFWLHHCNIDRLFAIWSAINPDSYVVPQVNDIGTYAEGPGATEDVNTPLWPFHRDSQGRFHTAATARDTKSFGYSYPEIVDWGVTTTQLASNVRSAFKALYNPAGTLDTRSVSRIMRRAGAQQVVDWFVNLSVKRNMDMPISINFFLGDPPVSPADWATAGNLIVSQMVLPDMTLSKAAPPALAQIPLSRSIQKAQKSGKLNGTDESTIRSFLRANLHWTVSSSDGQIIEVAKLTDLQISVVDQAVQKSNSTDQFHRYGKLKPNPGLQWNN